MMKEEFEKLLGNTVTDKEYSKIEFVYNFHPSISDTAGKQQIVDLYKLGGMVVIEGMIEVANYAQNIEAEQKVLREKLDSLKERMTDIKDGRLDFERCIAEVSKYYDNSNDFEEFKQLIKTYVEPKYSMVQINRAINALGIK